MDRKGTFFRVSSLSFLIMVTMIAIIIAVVTLLSAVAYMETRSNLEVQKDLSQKNAQQHLSDSIIVVANGLRLFELTYDKELRQAFVPFIDAYNLSSDDPMKIDLATIRNRLSPAIASRTDLYIIDEKGVVINATYSGDIGLDFSQWPAVFQDITQIRLGNEYSSDRAVIGFSPDKETRKFAYMPTPDHRYLLELSITVDEYSKDRSAFSFLSVADSIEEKYPDIMSVTLYDSMIREVTSDDEREPVSDPAIRDIITSVFDRQSPVLISDIRNHSEKRFIFIDSGGDETVSDNMLDIVARVDYDTSEFASRLNSTFSYHLLIAIISGLSGVLFVYLLTRYLTEPITRIIEDIDAIAKGDLDHPIHQTGSPEFSRLEGSINLLVQSMKSLIGSLREKEEHLAVSEKRYRSLIEHQTDLILRFDSTGRIGYMNEPFCRYFGISDSIGMTLFDIGTGEKKESIEIFIRQLQEKTQRQTFEQRLMFNGKKENWILWNSEPVSDENSGIVEYLAVGRDISLRKEAEIALRESEEKYRTLISSLPDYVIVHQNSLIVYANDAVIEELDYSPESFIGSSIFDHIYEEDIPLAQNNINRRINGERVDDYEVRILSRDHAIRTVNARAAPITYNDKPAIIAVLTDITEKKNAEQKYQEGEIRYRSLIEQLNEGIWMTDENAITTFTNAKMQELLHYGKDELVGKSFFTFISPDKIGFIMDRMINRKSGISDRYPMTFITKDGTRIFTEVSVTPSFSAEGQFSGSFALISDITERKLNEQKIYDYTRELEQKNRELEGLRDQLFIINDNLDKIVHKRTEQVMSLLKQKDEFIMQLGHDLRTPLTPIIGLLPELIGEEREGETRQALAIIEQNVRYIHDMANKSLKLARMNSFSINPEIEPVQVEKAITEILKVHEQDIRMAGITTTVSIPDNLVIAADKILFHELIENIISNGIKYIQRKDGLILITAERGADFIHITIRDNGIGLRAEETEKVFEEFYKSDLSRHDKSSTGLGLAICRKIVQNHGGSIRAESPGPGKGTSFIITLPIWNE